MFYLVLPGLKMLRVLGGGGVGADQCNSAMLYESDRVFDVTVIYF